MSITQKNKKFTITEILRGFTDEKIFVIGYHILVAGKSAPR